MDLLDLKPQRKLFQWEPMRPWERVDAAIAERYRKPLEEARPASKYVN